MTIESHIPLRTNRLEVFITYEVDKEKVDYLICTCWDLSVGIPRLDLGLSVWWKRSRIGIAMQGIERLWRLSIQLHPS